MAFWGYAFGLIVAIQPSYIHPDEHFQSLEVLAHAIGGVKGTISWEFDPVYAARSHIPLYLVYGPLYFVMFRILHIQDPVIILTLVRVQTYLTTIFIFHQTFRKICKSKRYDAVEFLMATSYVTCSIQSHSFSNCMETQILLLLLASYQHLISLHNHKPQTQTGTTWINVGIAFLITLGIFNRMTFPAFILLPSLRLFLKYYIHHFKMFSLFILSMISLWLVFIQFDTWCFQSNTYAIAPWNNLQYNLNVSNLKLHGLHPRYTHLLINIPQLIGPVLIFVFTSIKYLKFSDHMQRLPSLSIISALITLSFFPHQELRFLIPLVPLIFITFHDIHCKLWVQLWLLFNIIMALIMGTFHQSGVIRVIYHYQQLSKDYPLGIQIWWKTYMPPTWMYMDSKLTVSTPKTLSPAIVNSSHHIIDLQGSSLSSLNSTISQVLDNDNDDLILIVPSSMKSKLSTLSPTYNITEEYHTYAHLDLDHFDINDLTSFIPGISSYKVSKLA